MKIDGDNIMTIKLIFSLLGYTTKKSIGTIRNKKSVLELESEFLKIKSKVNDNNELSNIECFPSGMITNIIQISNHLNKKESKYDEEGEIKRHLLHQTNEVAVIKLLFRFVLKELLNFLSLY